MGLWDVDAARIAKIRGKPIEEAVANWDLSLDAAIVTEGAKERQRILDLFPLADWPTLELDRYALGTSVDESYCKLMEFRSLTLGSIAGGSALKHQIYKKQDGTWYFRPEYSDELEAWDAVRAGFVKAFELAAAGSWSDIDDIPAIQGATALRGKTAYVYFPDELVPIYAGTYQAHVYKALGGQGTAPEGVAGSRALFELVRDSGLFTGWDLKQVASFLGAWSNPRGYRRVVKIAPGNNAEFWDDCRNGGYICVGWDEVGDLKQFESKEQFRGAFGSAYPDYSPSKASVKANEVWTLMELQPGDTVIANQGTERIAGIGTVIEPAYVWRPDRGGPWAFHTVTVDWDSRPGWDIDPIKKWGMTTVSDVSGEEYKAILQRRSRLPVPSAGEDGIDIPPDALTAEIADVLERKGQVILYGPPGTGKTYTARRFGVWWLTKKRGEPEAQTLLGDKDTFDRAEGRLSSAQVERRVWWVVANPSEWSWSNGEREGKTDFRLGRLKRNYPLLQAGDLVVGYSANPEKRVSAIARIAQGLHEVNGQQRIEIEWLANVTNGPTYSELLADPLFSKSEPMRFRNQGTLFALTPDEADYMLALLRDRDPSLPLDLEDDEAVGQLTRVTFHPSYGYEDFVEGYKPIPTGTGQLDLRLVDGVFKRVCRAAQADPEHTYLLMVDEINRGNIPKIFGELITLLEKDKRNFPVVLPQSRQAFSVPPNVFMLGTMNTADRSIKLLDAALRRRFAFIELMPEMEPLNGGKVGDLDLQTFLSELNRRIAKSEGREKQIGHSFLLESGEPVSTADEFARRFRYEILPLLQEYSYDDYKELAGYLGKTLVLASEQALALPTDADELVAALAAEFQPAPKLVDQQAGPPDVPAVDSEPPLEQ